MISILENLKRKSTRESTYETYYRIWQSFNKFIIKLDYKPKQWEQRLSLYVAYLVEKGAQSATLKSYICEIKKILLDNGYVLNTNSLLLNTLTKACRLVNDTVSARLLIKCRLLEMLLFELGRLFEWQPYLHIMYKCLFILAYYGLFRIGELTLSQHSVKAKNMPLNLFSTDLYFFDSGIDNY